MTILYNQNNKKELRKILRKSMPKGEVLLWLKLKSKQTGYKFRRQYGVGRYVLDFYCVELRLGIEVDGFTHNYSDIVNYDEEREKYLLSKGIKLVRFYSQDVLDNPDDVATQVYFICKNLNDNKITSPSPSL